MKLLQIIFASLLPTLLWAQKPGALELPDVDAAILATELLQTDHAAVAEQMMADLGIFLLDSCYGTAHYTHLVSNRVVRFTLVRQRNSPRLRSVTFAAPAVENLLPKVLRRLGYRRVSREGDTAWYCHRRLGIKASLTYNPAWQVSSMTFLLTDDQ